MYVFGMCMCIRIYVANEPSGIDRVMILCIYIQE